MNRRLLNLLTALSLLLCVAVAALWVRSLVAADTWAWERTTPAHRGVIPFTYREWWLSLPLWLPAVLTACLPAGRLAGLRLKRRRPNERLCPSCVYDLRGGHASGRCPECGAPAPASAGTTEKCNSSQNNKEECPLECLCSLTPRV